MTQRAHRSIHRRPAAVLLLSAVLTLSACGGGEEDSGTATANAPTSEAAPPSSAEATGSTEADAGPQEVQVAAVDFDYELPTTEFTPGELTIELVNEGGASHDIVVERDGEEIGRTDVIAPGETASVTVDLEAGDYVFYCSVGNHRQMGMEIPVTVT